MPAEGRSDLRSASAKSINGGNSSGRAVSLLERPLSPEVLTEVLTESQLTLIGHFEDRPAELCSAGEFLVLRRGNAELAGYWAHTTFERVGPSPDKRGMKRLVFVGPDESNPLNRIVFDTAPGKKLDHFLAMHAPEVVSDARPSGQSLFGTTAQAEVHTPDVVVDEGDLEIEALIASATARPKATTVKTVEARLIDIASLFAGLLTVWNLGRTTAFFLGSGERWQQGDPGHFYLTAAGWMVIGGLLVLCLEAIRRLDTDLEPSALGSWLGSSDMLVQLLRMVSYGGGVAIGWHLYLALAASVQTSDGFDYGLFTSGPWSLSVLPLAGLSVIAFLLASLLERAQPCRK